MRYHGLMKLSLAAAGVLSLAVVLVWAGCGDDSESQTTAATTSTTATTGPMSTSSVGGSGSGGNGGAATSSGGSASGGNGSGGGAATSSDVTFTTSDNLTLHGFITTAPASPVGAPGVILVHQYLSDDQQWGTLPAELALAGYRTLAFDLRGHGDSDPYGSPLQQILTDPNGAPRDVDAALAYLAGSGQADPTRMAVVGTSIGANLAVASAIDDKAKTYVAFSARIPPTQALAGGQQVSGMTSVFYLASDLDSGNQAVDSQTMHDATTTPRNIKIYTGTADHGIAILRNQSDAPGLLLGWLSANL
jgi:dienelactone hydrolase